HTVWVVGPRSNCASARARTNVRVNYTLLRANEWRIGLASALRIAANTKVKTKQRGNKMNPKLLAHSFAVLIAFAIGSLMSAMSALAAVSLNGQVLGGGGPVANSTVTLWAATAGAPAHLGQARTGSDGRFTIAAAADPPRDATLYLVAKGGTPATNKAGGDNPAIALIEVVGAKPPPTVTINEMTTVASVWTHNQFIDGTAIKGQPLQLKIAAGNVPSFVDLATGSWGGAIQDPLNSGQTPTMANFATLADALAGCVARVVPDACSKLYAATAG